MTMFWRQILGPVVSSHLRLFPVYSVFVSPQYLQKLHLFELATLVGGLKIQSALPWQCTTEIVL
jgi:hypothetical protein